jgi:hypothetical protein
MSFDVKVAQRSSISAHCHLHIPGRQEATSDRLSTNLGELFSGDIPTHAELVLVLACGRALPGCREELPSAGRCRRWHKKPPFKSVATDSSPLRRLGQGPRLLLKEWKSHSIDAVESRVLTQRPCVESFPTVRRACLPGLSRWARASAPGTCSCRRDTPSLSACMATTPKMERMHN